MRGSGTKTNHPGTWNLCCDVPSDAHYLRLMCLNPPSSIIIWNTDFRKYSGIQAEPELADLLNEVAAVIPNQWYAVGIQLNLSDEDLRSWHDSNPYARKVQLFATIFTEWKKRSTMEYSWATIIKVLKTRSVDRFELADKLDSKLKG